MYTDGPVFLVFLFFISQSYGAGTLDLNPDSAI